MVKKGDAIKAVLLGIDKESHKIALGHKQLSDDPWTELSNSLVTGTQTQGKIIKIVNFGLFVELDNGLEGLIHISEIPQNLAGTLEKSFSVGSTIDVAVLSVDHDARRIALSLRNQS